MRNSQVTTNRPETFRITITDAIKAEKSNKSPEIKDDLPLKKRGKIKKWREIYDYNVRTWTRSETIRINKTVALEGRHDRKPRETSNMAAPMAPFRSRMRKLAIQDGGLHISRDFRFRSRDFRFRSRDVL